MGDAGGGNNGVPRLTGTEIAQLVKSAGLEHGQLGRFLFYAHAHKDQVQEIFQRLVNASNPDPPLPEDVKAVIEAFLSVAAAVGAGSGARSSDDRNRAGGPGRPRQQADGRPSSKPQTSATSWKLCDGRYKLVDRFPGIQEVAETKVVRAGDPGSRWSYLSVEYMIQKVVKEAKRYTPTIDMSNEAAVVHLISRVLAEVTYALRPSGVTGLFFNDSEPVSTDMVVTQQGESLLVGFEQGVKAGTMKGRIELQFVQEVTREGKRIYAGAVEVKRHTISLDDTHIEQAKKEAYALWCHNAVNGQHHQVWVLLTNGAQVIRVTYDGHNRPGMEAADYYDKMECKDVAGQLTVSKPYTLWNITDNHVMYHPKTLEGFAFLLSTFCTGEPPTLKQLQQWEKKHDEDLDMEVVGFTQHLILDASDTVKRKREEVDGGPTSKSPKNLKEG